MTANTPRISASSYSNTAPLIWSFLYGTGHGKVELVLDNAPARSAELLAEDLVDAALVPVIVSQLVDDVKLVPDICVGARERVRSVCIATNGADLADVRSIALDRSSRSSVVLTKIIFREFLGFEPEWRTAEPDLDAMLAGSDAALLIGDPALTFAPEPNGNRLKFDLVELWRRYTGFGFVFAMWMTRRGRVDVDLAAARDEGLAHLSEIVANYQPELRLGHDEMITYLSDNISYTPDVSMHEGMKLYFELAEKCGLIPAARPVAYL